MQQLTADVSCMTGETLRRSARNRAPVQKLNYDTLGGDNTTDIAEKKALETVEVESDPVQEAQQYIPMVEVPSDAAMGAEVAGTQPVPTEAVTQPVPTEGVEETPDEELELAVKPQLNAERKTSQHEWTARNEAGRMEAREERAGASDGEKEVKYAWESDDNQTPLRKEDQSNVQTLEDVSLDVLNARSFYKNGVIRPVKRPLLDKGQKIKFQGSVPESCRKKIREFVESNYDDMCISREDISKGQEADPYFRDLIIYLKHRILPQKKALAKRILSQEDCHLYINKLLWRLPNGDGEGGERFRMQLCIPEALAGQVIEQIHGTYLEAAHSAYLATLLAVKRKFYIHNLSKKVQDVVDVCGVCNRVKRSAQATGATEPLTITAGKAERPFETLQMDFFAPVVPCDQHNVDRVLMITDTYSGYIFMYSTKGESAPQCAEALRDLFRRYGIPQNIASDRGSAFISQLNGLLFKIWGIKRKLASALSPQSSGLCERMNGIAKELLNTACLGKQGLCFDKLLPEIAFAVNTRISARTNLSAFYIFHGFEPVTPTDLETGSCEGIKKHSLLAEEVVAENDRRHDFVKRIKSMKDEKTKFVHDSAISEVPHINVGDLCLVSTPRHFLNAKNSKKGRVLNSGPFQVAAVVGPTVLLTDLQGQVLPDLINKRRIRVIPGYRKNFYIDRVGDTAAKLAAEGEPKDLVASIQYTQKFKVKGGKKCVLAYPLGLKTCGVWIPTDEVKLN